MTKVTEAHLRKRAVVYLRQSSMAQVRNNLESQRLQYGMVERARSLGWKQVDVIDRDLGSSASAGSSERIGFEELISRVALGEVGIVLSRELSRLSRTDKDWCRLLEVCRYFGTLVADEQQVYDVNAIDDQLVLGIKGTLSAVELSVLRTRMLHGRDAKAARGELEFRLPAGYQRDADGHPVKDPDARARAAIDLLFRKFRELRVSRQVFVWFHDEGIEVPIHQFVGGKLQRLWRVPTELYVQHVLKNPFYAGAYVYGRRPFETKLVDGKVVKRVGKLRDPEECKVFIREHHEGYISWSEYEQNVACLRTNAPRSNGRDSMTAARGGAGLLVGLLRCGHCGRKLTVNYWGRSGTSPRYVCRGTSWNAGTGCLGFAGKLVERDVEQQVLAAISPLGVEASLAACAELTEATSSKRIVLQRRAEQLRYEARRAFEQYNEVDPRNRLVAAELERRWNDKLAAADEAEEELRQVDARNSELDDETRRRLQQLGEDFAQAWHAPECSAKLKQKIVRVVLEEVLVRRQEDELVFVLHWAGGTHTQLRVHQPPAGSHHKTSSDALEVIRALAPKYDDGTIAGVLAQHGLVTGTGMRWNKGRVRSARHRHGIRPTFVAAEERGLLNLVRAAQHCSTSTYVIRRLLHAGLIHNEQTVAHAPLEIPIADLDSAPVRAALSRLRSTGTLGLGGGVTDLQADLFEENQGDTNAR